MGSVYRGFDEKCGGLAGTFFTFPYLLGSQLYLMIRGWTLFCSVLFDFRTCRSFVYLRISILDPCFWSFCSPLGCLDVFELGFKVKFFPSLEYLCLLRCLCGRVHVRGIMSCGHPHLYARREVFGFLCLAVRVFGDVAWRFAVAGVFNIY